MGGGSHVLLGVVGGARARFDLSVFAARVFGWRDSFVWRDLGWNHDCRALFRGRVAYFLVDFVAYFFCVHSLSLLQAACGAKRNSPRSNELIGSFVLVSVVCSIL